MGCGRRGGFIAELHHVHGKEWRLLLRDLLRAANEKKQDQRQRNAMQEHRARNTGALLHNAPMISGERRKALSQRTG
jgi:hypothetical protein